MKMLTLLILLLSGTTFCQNSYYQRLGQLIEGFENLNDWTFEGASVFDSLISTNHTEGNFSIKLGTYGSEVAIMTKTISLNFDDYKTFSIEYCYIQSYYLAPEQSR